MVNDDLLLELLQVNIKNQDRIITALDNLAKAVISLQKETSEAEKNLKKVSNSPPFLVFGFAFAAANIIAFPLNSEWVALITLALFSVDHREVLGERRLKRIQEAIVFIVIAIVAVYLVFHCPKEEKAALENSDQRDSDPHDSDPHTQEENNKYTQTQDTDFSSNYQQNHKQTQTTQEADFLPSTHMKNCFCEECKTNYARTALV